MERWKDFLVRKLGRYLDIDIGMMSIYWILSWHIYWNHGTEIIGILQSFNTEINILWYLCIKILVNIDLFIHFFIELDWIGIHFFVGISIIFTLFCFFFFLGIVVFWLIFLTIMPWWITPCTSLLFDNVTSLKL